MSIHLKAKDIFGMAELIEQKAVAFYNKAAETSEDCQAQDLFRNLARMEDDHEHVFAAMKHGLRPRKKANTIQDHLPHIGSDMLLNMDGAMESLFKGQRSIPDIIRAALTFEKDTIVFFVGMKAMISGRKEKAKIDALIREELGHVIWLGSQLATM